jgi:hypothetical protein
VRFCSRVLENAIGALIQPVWQACEQCTSQPTRPSVQPLPSRAIWTILGQNNARVKRGLC